MHFVNITTFSKEISSDNLSSVLYQFKYGENLPSKIPNAWILCKQIRFCYGNTFNEWIELYFLFFEK